MTTNTPAGWYTDPHDATGLRYWDGSTWTEHTHRPDGTAAAAASDATSATAVMPVVSSPTAQTEQFEVPPTDGGEAPVYAAAAPAAATGSYGDGAAYYGDGTGAPVDSPKKGLGGGAIVAIVAGAVILILAVAAILIAVLSSGSDDAPAPATSNGGEATAAPAPEATADEAPVDEADTADEPPTSTGEAIVPAGWTQVTSPSGLISYAYALDMADAGEFIDLDTLSDQLSGVFPGATAEVSGMWIDTSATETSGSSVMIMTTTGGVDSSDLGAELEAFATSASAGTDDVVIGDAENFVTAVGYDAARLSYSSSSFDVPSYATVSIVIDGETSVIVFASSPADAASAAEMAQQVVDSLVINP